MLVQNLSSTWNKIKQRDDVLHVYSSIIITMVTSEVVYAYTKYNVNESILIGASTSLAIGVLGKEFIHDRWLGYGTYNVMDIFYDAWGTVIAVIIERCWMDWKGYGKTQYEQDYFDSQIRTKKHKKKHWSFKNTGLLR